MPADDGANAAARHQVRCQVRPGAAGGSIRRDAAAQEGAECRGPSFAVSSDNDIFYLYKQKLQIMADNKEQGF